MQALHFLERGFDIGHLYRGTLNVSIAPMRYRVVKAKYTFPSLKWHPTEPAEDFSFFDCRLVSLQAPPLAGFIYYPHPDTKPAHFQQPDVLELLLPFVEGLTYGMTLSLEIPTEQMVFEFATLPAEASTSHSNATQSFA